MLKLTGLIVSDTHLGDAYAVFPHGFKGSTGSVIALNEGQKYLLECWDWMIEQLPRRLDFLIVNGDVADGVARKDEGRWRVESDPEFQVLAAKALFMRGNPPLLNRAKKKYVSKGSAYHSGSGSHLDEMFGQQIKAEVDSMGHRASSWRVLSCQGIDVDIAHNRSVSIRYESSQGEREIQFDRMVADIKDGSSDLIVRSHGHRYVKLNVDGDIFVATPAWSLQTDYAKMSRYPNRWLSRLIGSVRVDLYPELKTGGLQDKEEYVKITGLTCPHPKVGKELL